MFGPSVVLLFASFIMAAPPSSTRKSSHSFPTHTNSPSFAHTPTNYHPRPPDPPPSRQESQRNATIVISAIAGSVILGFLIAIFRCIYRYKRPPKRDRIAEVLQRHNLQCEMQALSRNPRALRRPSLREPAPPYFPRPPSYSESVVNPASAEHSRNHSISSSTRILLPNSPSTPNFPFTH